MLSKLDILVSHVKWLEKTGSRLNYNNMHDLIMEILGTGDKRTIAFWIGQEKRIWVKDEANKYYVEKKEIGRWVYPRKAVYEWTDGFLQRHGYVETIEASSPLLNRTFKILKGLQDGKETTQPIISQNAPHP